MKKTSRTARAPLPGRPLGGLRGPFPGLRRLRVLDFTKLLPGPYATQLLADLGCRVTKIELPYFADGARAMPPEIDGVGSLFWMVNQGKRLLSADFRAPAGLRKVRRLIAEADVLVEGFRPGLMDRVGLGAEEVRRLNPRLVYCSLTGYPPEGAWRRKAGHDLNFLAVSGLIGLKDSSGGFSFPAAQVADLSSSLAATTGIFAALVERGVTGRGRHITISMAETAHSLLAVPLGEAAAQGRDPDGPRWWNGAHPFYRLYETAGGGRLAVAALEKPYAIAVLDALGLEGLKGLAEDPLANAPALAEGLSRVLRTATAAAWSERFKDKDLCITPVLRLGEAAAFLERLRRPESVPARRERRNA